MSLFNVAEIYQDSVPRKQWEPSDPKTWVLGSQDAFTVVADDGTPKMMNFVSEIRILWKSPTWDEQIVGNGLIDIIYPEYDDNVLKTHTIKSLEELQIMADKTVDVGSDTNYIIELKPPVKLEGSNSNKTLTVSKNSNVNDMTGGEVVITAKGWKLKEADFGS